MHLSESPVLRDNNNSLSVDKSSKKSFVAESRVTRKTGEKMPKRKSIASPALGLSDANPQTVVNSGKSNDSIAKRRKQEPIVVVIQHEKR